MAVKWTAQRDQNLLLLIIQDVKVDFNQLAQKWQAKFPNEDFNPTAKAVSEHVAALKRKIGASSGASVAAGSTPTSKSKAKGSNSNPKTPTSKPKQSRAAMMSNEDDSEEEKGIDFDTPIPKRTTPSRHRTPKKYKEADSESEDDDVIITSSSKSTKTNGAMRSPVDASSPRGSIARSKSNPPKMDYFRDSDSTVEEDVSDFEPVT